MKTVGAISLLWLAAGAGDWAATFAPSVVATYLEGDAPTIAVIAGDTAVGTFEAATALEASLRAVQRVRLVMSGASLGDPTGLSDEQLAVKAKGRPVETVAVVRVFPGSDAPVVVVTFLTPEGVVQSAFTAPQGKAPPPREGGATRGVSGQALKAIDRDQNEKRGTSPSAELSEFDRKHIEWTDVVSVSGTRLMVWSSARQGVEKRPLVGEELYVALGRSDLAKDYQTRSGWRTGLLVGGGVLAVGGVGLALGQLAGVGCSTYSGTPNRPGVCVGRDPSMLYAALALGGLGSLACTIGFTISPHPVSAEEARQLSEDFNRSLKKSVQSTSITVSPIASADGVGLGMRGSF